jgi:hypothetical protein
MRSELVAVWQRSLTPRATRCSSLPKREEWWSDQDQPESWRWMWSFAWQASWLSYINTYGTYMFGGRVGAIIFADPRYSIDHGCPIIVAELFLVRWRCCELTKLRSLNLSVATGKLDLAFQSFLSSNSEMEDLAITIIYFFVIPFKRNPTVL